MSLAFKLRKKLLDIRDKRMREMNQVIQAIKVYRPVRMMLFGGGTGILLR